VGRLVRNLKLRRPITLTALSARFFFVSAYLYLLTVGRNIPEWVYAMLATMIAYGAVSTIRRIQRHVAGA